MCVEHGCGDACLLESSFQVRRVEEPAATMPTSPSATSVATNLRETFFNLSSLICDPVARSYHTLHCPHKLDPGSEGLLGEPVSASKIKAPISKVAAASSCPRRCGPAC